MFAGSFNPPTLGHVAMIEYLSNRFEKVTLVVGFNPNKTYDVSPQERARILSKLTCEMKNVQVQLVKGLIWRYAMKNGADCLIRGIRSWDKDGKEEQHLHYQNTIYPIILGPLWWPIPTLFLEGKPEYNHISSTLVRKLCEEVSSDDQHEKLHEHLSQLIPVAVIDDVAKAFSY